MTKSLALAALLLAVAPPGRAEEAPAAPSGTAVSVTAAPPAAEAAPSTIAAPAEVVPAKPQPDLAALKARKRPLAPPSAEVLQAIGAERTPVLVYDLDQVSENYLNLKKSLGIARIYYAMEAAPDPRVLSRLAELGSGIAAASRAELELALAAGCPPDRVNFSNTVKRAEDVRFAYEKGVRLYAADELAEVERIAVNAPGSNVYVRLAAANAKAHYPEGDKFGAEPDKAKALLRRAKELGLVPYGLAFHIGSQVYDAGEWRGPIEKAAAVLRELRGAGMELRFLDIGGGFPTRYGKDVPTVEQIGAVVAEMLAREVPGTSVELAAEPGRFLVGDAAVLAGRTLLRASRGGTDWLHLDVGIYNGLAEAAQGIPFEVTAPGKVGPMLKYTLAGPTNETTDVVLRGVELPVSVDEGDLILFQKAGAYVLSASSGFNGFPPPKVLYTDRLQPAEK